MDAMENDQPTDGPQEPGLSLSRILDDHSIEHLENRRPVDAPAGGWDEEIAVKALEDGYCVECEGMLISLSGFDPPDLFYLMPQTNRHRCIVNLARTTFVRFALQRNIAKDPGNSTGPNH